MKYIVLLSCSYSVCDKAIWVILNFILYFETRCSPGWPKVYFVDQAGLKFIEISLPLNSEIKDVCYHIQLRLYFLIIDCFDFGEYQRHRSSNWPEKKSKLHLSAVFKCAIDLFLFQYQRNKRYFFWKIKLSF